MPELEELMCWMVDTVLKFEDGELQCNSAVLGLFSSVLRGAVEAHTAGSSSSTSRLDSMQIPVEGVTKEEWIETAAFWYPVVPAPEVTGWEQAELLLKVAARYNIQCVLHKVDMWLLSKAAIMTASTSAAAGSAAAAGAEAQADSADSVWKWLHLADTAGLTVCLPSIAKQAVTVDRAGCTSLAKLRGLSNGALLEMMAALAEVSVCGKCRGGTGYCNHCRTTRQFAYKCNSCRN